MRFERLSVPAFGPFTGLELRLPAGPADLHLIYGPNEAGKSSLLRAIRDLLYGIHAQTPDAFRHDYKDLRIGGTLVAADGRRLDFQRRKGNRSTLLDEAGNALPDDCLTGLLGGVDRDFFSTLFGLGADELRRGAAALLQGQGEVGQALFSASLAGTPVHGILESLENEARAIYAGRARTNVTLRPALNAYEDGRRRSREAAVRPEIWEAVLEAVAAATRERDGLDARLRACRERRDWLQRCLDALPSIGRLLEQQERRAGLPPMPDLGNAFIQSAEAAMAGAGAARLELTRLQGRIGQLEDRLEAARPRADLLSRRARIESLHQRLALYRQWRDEQSGLAADLARLDYDLRAGLSALGLDGEPDAAESLRVLVAEELAMGEAARRLDAAGEALQKNRDVVAALDQELEEVAGRLGALATLDAGALRPALAQTAAAAETLKRLGPLDAECTGARRRLEAQQGLLRLGPGDPGPFAALPVPAAATLRQFEQEASRIEARRNAAEAELDEAGDRLRGLSGRLERLERGGVLPSIADLYSARVARDRAWDRVLVAWKQGAEEGELDGLPLAEAYPRSVLRSDEIADRLREDAGTIAQADELRLQLREAERAQSDGRAAIEEARVALADWQARWAAAWSPCGIDPLSPAEMLEWRDQWAELRARYEDWRGAEETLTAARSEIQVAVLSLAPLLPECGDGSLPVLREQAERKVREADQAEGARAELRERELDGRTRRDALAKARPGLENALAGAAAAWAERCRALGLLGDPSIEVGLELLERRKRLLVQLDAWKGLRLVTAEKGEAIEDFGREVNRLADELGLPDAAVEVRESDLWMALEGARELQARQTEMQANLERERDELPRARQALAEAEARVAEAVATSGSPDEPALQTLLLGLKAREALDAEIERLRQMLHLPARGEPLEPFIERVRGERGESLSAECEALDREIPALEAERDQALQRLLKAEGDRFRLEQCGAEAADCLEVALGQAAVIRQEASRYLRLQLAMHFLRQQIEQFRRDNQAPLLARAGELFRRITGGSFEDLGTDYDADDRAVLVGLRGRDRVGVEGMSEGTRDQLYLALRLAAIERRQEHHEPMPLILDDLLVSFDDRRASAILEILSDLGRRTQVLLFSHHRHLVDLARSALPPDSVRVHVFPFADGSGWGGRAG